MRKTKWLHTTHQHNPMSQPASLTLSAWRNSEDFQHFKDCKSHHFNEIWDVINYDGSKR